MPWPDQWDSLAEVSKRPTTFFYYIKSNFTIFWLYRTTWFAVCFCRVQSEGPDRSGLDSLICFCTTNPCPVWCHRRKRHLSRQNRHLVWSGFQSYTRTKGESHIYKTSDFLASTQVANDAGLKRYGHKLRRHSKRCTDLVDFTEPWLINNDVDRSTSRQSRSS